VTITAEGGRVLGCLVEKQLTTPAQYPLTLNALSLACSQSTNREPVMAMDDRSIQAALQELKELRLVRFVLPSHGKSVTRYRHVLDEAYGLDTARMALLAVLLLRGPQTPGELRARTGRMADFDSPGAVTDELEVLADQPEPLVRLLPRQPGQKEDRWQQLLATELAAQAAGWSSPAPDGPEDRGSAPAPAPAPAATGADDHPSALDERVEQLASEVAALREELAAVSASLGALRRSLGEGE
jgi:uncharacterized protein YceH (UPF0502 family)